jgi:peptide deformylase
MLEIIKYPNKILRQKSKEVENCLELSIQHFIQELIETMLFNQGLGLAAPQVGKNINIIAIHLKEGAKVFINPKVIWKSWFKKNILEEGCLSFPDIFGLVKRPKVVWLKYIDKNAKLKINKFQGLLATVLQHEIDHLRGKLFIDRIFKYTKGESEVRELQKQAGLDER